LQLFLSLFSNKGKYQAHQLNYLQYERVKIPRIDAKVGYERIQEIENPELATQRTRALYKAKGYPEDWIEKRMRGIAIQEELTTEWENRGIEQERDYAILTAEISKATFGMTPSDYKKHKGLKQENLRDHMPPIELVFSMLGEVSTKEIAVNQNAQGFAENKAAAQSGGRIAGDARKQLEKESGKPVISKTNYLGLTTTKPIEIDTKKENS
jgi:DNA-damage-inducible protein D